jgi:type VI secretion system protein ImpE
MTSAEWLKEGNVDQSLAALQSEIREKPEDSSLRIFLFQLNCILGRWEKALIQLQVVASLTPETMLLAQIFRPVIACEMLRKEVFEGRRTALIFGEPMEWMGSLVHANTLVAEGNFKAAAEMRSQAFEAAPATRGKINGNAFEWLADSDSRLGPVLEFFMEGKYYWVPFSRVLRLEIEKPMDLRDLVWIPARVRWSNGGEAVGHIPVRYAGTENSAESGLLLARKTVWREEPGETTLGLGQRLFATEAADYPLLEIRTIELEPSA